MYWPGRGTIYGFKHKSACLIFHGLAILTIKLRFSTSNLGTPAQIMCILSRRKKSITIDSWIRIYSALRASYNWIYESIEFRSFSLKKSVTFHLQFTHCQRVFHYVVKILWLLFFFWGGGGILGCRLLSIMKKHVDFPVETMSQSTAYILTACGCPRLHFIYPTNINRIKHVFLLFFQMATIFILKTIYIKVMGLISLRKSNPNF